MFCRPQRLVEDDAQAAKMSDASVTSAANYTRSLDAANHLRERVLFIGTEFSILYTFMHSPA